MENGLKRNKKIRNQNSDLSRVLLNPIKEIDLYEFHNERLFNYDGYQKKPTIGRNPKTK